MAELVSVKETTVDESNVKSIEETVVQASSEETEKGPSKTQLNKEKKKAEKLALRAAEKKEKEESSAANSNKAADLAVDNAANLYGDLPIIRSTTITDRVFKNIVDISDDLIGQRIWLRARVSTSRGVGKGCFIVLRQNLYTAQAVMFQGEKVSKGMVKFATGISLESVVDIFAEVTRPEAPINSVTLKNLELSICEIYCASRAQELPFQVEDAGRNEAEAHAAGLPLVNQDTALNFRWIDTRTPANQAIFRMQAAVCQLFREYLTERNFVEIHTPKLIGGSSEGGSNVFKLSYFDQPACLAQSPQLYKQMTSACGGFERVFEIGPVFRAENSNTHRHLCEFTGLDFEMCIIEHYYEALEVMGGLFNYIFDGLTDRYSHLLSIIGQQYPVEPLQYLRPPLRITFNEGISLLKAEGNSTCSYTEDLSTADEKQLGRIVKEKFHTDFYIMDKYPLSVRPFYTMPCPEDPTLSNSYDLFIRGEEIVSGAQRIHDPVLLTQRAEHWGIPVPTVQSYIDAFKHGALPHAGGGIGLERVCMLYLGLKNIRKTSMFPRDPSRLTP